MASRHAKPRHSISLAALLLAWAFVTLWFCWTEVTGKAIDDLRDYEIQQEKARSQPLASR